MDKQFAEKCSNPKFKNNQFTDPPYSFYLPMNAHIFYTPEIQSLGSMSARTSSFLRCKRAFIFVSLREFQLTRQQDSPRDYMKALVYARLFV
jgi:hypothetical protein